VGFDKVMNIDLEAPFMLTQALLPELESGAPADDPAHVIMIGSLGAHVVGRHITVNSIAPGPFESKTMEYMPESEDTRSMVIDNVPRKRIGTAEDIAGTVIFLSSRAGAFTTGATVPVDGGISTTRIG
jgi:NAD(P)-dependent dehydrogenase (short-subunit alcohol dehydrogenase family)